MEAGTREEQEREDQEQQNGSGDKANMGRVEEVQGVVIEAVFPDKIPDINHALVMEIEDEQTEDDDDGDKSRQLVFEVQQHLGDDRVRAVAMDSTDGVARGNELRDTGGPISVPVGEGTLGRIFNLLGETIDGEGDADTDERWPIHRAPPRSRT